MGRSLRRKVSLALQSRLFPHPLTLSVSNFFNPAMLSVRRDRVALDLILSLNSQLHLRGCPPRQLRASCSWFLVVIRSRKSNSPLCDVHHCQLIADQLFSVIRGHEWEITMRAITDQTTQPSFGASFAHLFDVNVDRFLLSAQKPECDRDCEYLNRPYELSDLMRQTIVLGVRPR
jgi:hypothetical protein